MAHLTRKTSRKSTKTEPDSRLLFPAQRLYDMDVDSSPPSLPLPTRSTPLSSRDKARLLEAERDKLALELELMKLKADLSTNDGEHAPDATRKGKQRKKRQIDWPQEFYAGAFDIEFEKLDMPAFVAGFIAMIKPYEANRKEDMLQLLELLMLKASNYSWNSVRAFYAQVARQVELCRLEFSDYGAIRDCATVFFKHSDLRPNQQQKTQNNDSSRTTTTGQQNDKTTQKPCRQWNYTGSCKCDSTNSSYNSHHKCRVCGKDHPMLHCAKRRTPIPDSTGQQ